MTTVLAALLALAPYFLLAYALPALIHHDVPAANHDAVLSIVSGLIGVVGGPAIKAGAQHVVDAVLPRRDTPEGGA